MAGIGGSHPLGNRERKEERDSGRWSWGGRRGSETEWQEPGPDPDGYCGDALFANFESSFEAIPRNTPLVGLTQPPPALSSARPKNASFFPVVILGHAVALIMYTKVAFLSSQVSLTN